MRRAWNHCVLGESSAIPCSQYLLLGFCMAQTFILVFCVSLMWYKKLNALQLQRTAHCYFFLRLLLQRAIFCSINKPCGIFLFLLMHSTPDSSWEDFLEWLHALHTSPCFLLSMERTDALKESHQDNPVQVLIWLPAWRNQWGLNDRVQSWTSPSLCEEEEMAFSFVLQAVEGPK